MKNMMPVLIPIAIILTTLLAAWVIPNRKRKANLDARSGQGRAEFANITEGTYSTGLKSYLPDASTTARYLLYKRGSDADHCALCGAADDPLGPSDDQADTTTGVPITIQVLGACRGTVLVTTDGTVNDGDYCKCGANGKVTKASTGDLSFGRAMVTSDMSNANGDVIGMIPTLPAKYSF